MAEEKLKVKSSAAAKAKADKEKLKVKNTTKKEKVSKEMKVETKKVEANSSVGEKRVNASLKLAVFDTNGKEIEQMELPKELFGEKPNKVLLARAIRVYLTNQRQGDANTQTRGEVEGSTRKIYRQKGTGRARHGGIRAPIFVKGGTAHGPKTQDYNLTLNKKMKKKVLAYAISQRLLDGAIKLVDGLEKLESKTKNFNNTFNNLGLKNKKRNILLVTDADNEKIYKGSRNLAGVKVTTAKTLNIFEILKYKDLVLTKNSVKTLTERTK